MVYVITGGPATGKGTRSDILSKALNIPHISTGDILRDVAQTNEKINKKPIKFCLKILSHCNFSLCFRDFSIYSISILCVFVPILVHFSVCHGHSLHLPRPHRPVRTKSMKTAVFFFKRQRLNRPLDFLQMPAFPGCLSF